MLLSLLLRFCRRCSLTDYPLKSLPDFSNSLLRDNLSLISGSHAELRLFGDHAWQIKDLGSRNGTFINGNPQKLQDWHSLNDGDLICLGSASQSEGSATFIFEVPSSEDIHPALVEVQKLLDCNILCLVIPAEPLSENIHRFIQLAKNTFLTKFWIIVDRPGSINDDAFREVFSGIANSLKNRYQDISFELTSLLLNPFIPSSGATVLTPHAQPEFEQFWAKLESIAKESAEATLVEWGNNKLNTIVNQIEDHLIQKSFTFQEKLKNDEDKFKELSQGNLKKQVEKICKKVDGERDSFFRQVKTELSQSKVNLLDEFRQSSISYTIQKFTKQLQPHVSDQGTNRYVRLMVRDQTTGNSMSNDVHAAAIELCHTELTNWATSEWTRIQSEYIGGGFNSFVKKSYNYLNFIPELELSEDGFSSSQTLSIQSILNVSSVEPTVESRYKQVDFWGYMFKNLRGQVISIAGLLTMVGGGIVTGGILVPILLPVAGAAVWLSYKQDKEAKIEEATERLRKETTSYYQSYIKGLVDRLVQKITGLLESEERYFREILENIKETYTLHLAEIDKKQSQLKLQIDEMRRSGQNKIDKDFAELKKLK
jgi:hypothetical protein